MTGLEKIMDGIREEARAAAEEALRKARSEAERLTAEAESLAARRQKEIQENGRRRLSEVSERGAAALELERRRALLKAKQEIIEDVLRRAGEELRQLPEEQYFEVILNMAAAAAHKGERGEICFSERDRARLPENFAESLAKALPEGGSLELSERAVDISGGFVLDYGGVEENGSFEAIFAEKRERLQDKVRDILF